MQKKSFVGDVIMGGALGPVFSTCSPTYFVILATVLPSNFLLGLVYLIAYSIGLGLALLAISLFGQRLADKLAMTSESTGYFKKSLGVVFLAVAILIISGYDKKLQVWISTHVFDITKIERRLLQSTEKMGGVNLEGVGTKTGSGFTSLGKYQEIANPAGFINTQGKPIQLSDYIGKKIILIDFMTYSCINCIRTFPYLVDWDTKYRAKGLIIIGIHTPEFAFEKKIENVEKALKEYGITFPIVLDNDYGTWNAYQNQYWPRKFIIDLSGNIVYDHIGEGEYQETEEIIQRLLRTIPGNQTLSIETKADDSSLMPTRGVSPESYLGYGRIEYHTTPIKNECQDTLCEYVLASKIPLNRFSFGGKWTLDSEHALGETGSIITFNADAKKVHLVAGPENTTSQATVEVYIDGVLTKTISIVASDLYTLFDGSKRETHLVKIKIIKGRILGYAYTFG